MHGVVWSGCWIRLDDGAATPQQGDPTKRRGTGARQSEQKDNYAMLSASHALQHGG
jgi:hypothetical protein